MEFVDNTLFALDIMVHFPLFIGTVAAFVCIRHCSPVLRRDTSKHT